ncbi:aryl-alcohol dehydrogenase [Podospora aff. communis PSN243]|uniref:Aryl-alcohol dehydrogenase n=1 Tax=Podospora aff. communis PSN243 TaxID=3040156 RepID=A0AAV9GEZ9_9PEZI|nr:aryl-alcohol dehydrogenase [Podospora aff. communis PSN243]
MSRSTTALVVPELNGKFQLQQIYLNDIQPDEVLVEIVASGFCHTDLSCALGLLPCAPNAVLGHEGAGIVISTGPEVTGLTPGDKVLLSFSFCGSCRECASGHPAYCHSFNERNFGGARPDGSGTTAMLSTKGGEKLFSSFFGQSSFSKHTLVHKSSVVKVAPETDLALFASLGCGMQTGAGAVLNTLDVKEGSTVAVFGVGSVGMAAVMAAGLIRKAKTVIAIDLQQSRLDLAKELGATHGIIGSAKDVVEQIKALCPPTGVDYAVDCTGVPAVVRTMIDALGVRGRAATVGAPGPGHVAHVDIMTHLTYGKEYVGCSEGDSLPAEFIPHLMEMHAQGRFPLERLIEYYDIKDFEQAIEDAKSGKTIKPVLKWSSIN